MVLDQVLPREKFSQTLLCYKILLLNFPTLVIVLGYVSRPPVVRKYIAGCSGGKGAAHFAIGNSANEAKSR